MNFPSYVSSIEFGMILIFNSTSHCEATTTDVFTPFYKHILHLVELTRGGEMKRKITLKSFLKSLDDGLHSHPPLPLLPLPLLPTLPPIHHPPLPHLPASSSFSQPKHEKCTSREGEKEVSAINVRKDSVSRERSVATMVRTVCLQN